MEESLSGIDSFADDDRDNDNITENKYSMRINQLKKCGHTIHSIHCKLQFLNIMFYEGNMK